MSASPTPATASRGLPLRSLLKQAGCGTRWFISCRHRFASGLGRGGGYCPKLGARVGELLILGQTIRLPASQANCVLSSPSSVNSVNFIRQTLPAEMKMRVRISLARSRGLLWAHGVIVACEACRVDHGPPFYWDVKLVADRTRAALSAGLNTVGDLPVVSLKMVTKTCSHVIRLPSVGELGELGEPLAVTFYFSFLMRDFTD